MVRSSPPRPRARILPATCPRSIAIVACVLASVAAVCDPHSDDASSRSVAHSASRPGDRRTASARRRRSPTRYPTAGLCTLRASGYRRASASPRARAWARVVAVAGSSRASAADASPSRRRSSAFVPATVARNSGVGGGDPSPNPNPNPKPSGGDEAREGDASVPVARVVEDGGVHAQWIEPASEPPGWGRRAKTSADGDARPVCLIFVVSSGDDGVAAVAGEASFDVREVRAMQREVRTMRKELADAGEAGVERARLDAFLRKFADFIEGPPPLDPKRARSRSQIPTRDPEDPAGGDAGDGAGDGDAPPAEEAPPAMTTAEDVSLLSALEAFASPEGGYCGVNPALCAILHPALAKRRASRP
mmetsp:Transcript_5462/g.22409  ORF Transcript_5462/g.22409 Transcript_5462/m.22409 type:complete len:363 (-) Transcript_5462:74-1162(-)